MSTGGVMARPASILEGQIFKTNLCGNVEVLKYHDALNVEVIFLDYGIIKKVDSRALRKGSISIRKGFYGIGDTFKLNTGGTARVVEYRNYDNAWVVFEGYENNVCVKTKIDTLLRGQLSNPYHPTYYGKGYLDFADTKTATGDSRRSYRVWQGILTRCYGECHTPEGMWKLYGGRGVTVCKDWYSYYNFKQWYESFENSDNSLYAIDKDLRVLGSKEYSPSNCSLVYYKINTLLAISPFQNEIRYPLGVWKEEGFNKFRAKCLMTGKRVSFSKMEDAVDFRIQSYKDRVEYFLMEADSLGLDTHEQVRYTLENLDFKHLIYNRELKLL